jgi:hypothetical protein
MMKDIDRFVSDDCICILRAFSEDPKLRKWFVSLQDVSENIRVSMLGAMVLKMKANKEDPELIAEFELLVSPNVFSAAVKAILNFTNGKETTG